MTISRGPDVPPLRLIPTLDGAIAQKGKTGRARGTGSADAEPSAFGR